MRTRISYSLLAFLCLVLPLAAEDNLKYGQPACAGPVLDRKFFVVCHDGEHKIPKWVGYALTRKDLSDPVADRDEGGFRFKADPDLPPQERAKPTDYSKSGYQQGHMAPAADFKRSVEAMSATFMCVHRGGEKEMFAFVLPNLDKLKGTLADYGFSVNYVEKLTALDFFGKLPADEQAGLERAVKALPGE